MKQNYVWYCSYGSNILEERFLCYIKGGKPKGSKKTYLGCTDKTSPIDIEETYIASELYFAESSKTWNGGGVAFIRNEFSEARTLAKMYLISETQFLEVLQQESNLKTIPKVDFKSVIKNQSTVLKEIKWYNKIVYLGEQANFPIFTFTHGEKDFTEINKPDSAYLKIIIEGLKESFNYNENDVVEYFKTTKGVAENYSKKEIVEITLTG